MKLLIHPFPHLIIYDFYDEKELRLIWQELDFLTSPNKLLPANINGSSSSSNALSISLSQVYKEDRFSNISLVNQKILSNTIRDAFSSLDPLLGHIKYVNKIYTKVKYYEDGHHYPAHTDNELFTAVNYFYKEPKSFTGGELYFNDHDYKIELKNNMFILFPGCITHSVLPIALNQNDYITGKGKYSITQFLTID